MSISSARARARAKAKVSAGLVERSAIALPIAQRETAARATARVAGVRRAAGKVEVVGTVRMAGTAKARSIRLAKEAGHLLW